MSKITYTKTDEAPALATYSFLPIIKSFVKHADIHVDFSDISLAGRIIAVFPDFLDENQIIPDALSDLGELAKKPGANIIKLPNISASIPQLKSAIKELQEKGYQIPNYPEDVQNKKAEEIKKRYDKIKGSAVNPVLREGNSDRRAPKAVKEFAKKNPHSMGKWSPNSKTDVSFMNDGDFKNSEKSITITNKTEVQVLFTNEQKEQTILKESIPLLKGEIIDASLMSKKKLISFIDSQISFCKNNNLLFSLHMKATMMKVSDPIIFGHAVKCFFKSLFNEYNDLFHDIGVNVNNGFGDLLKKISSLPEKQQKEIDEHIKQCYSNNPDIAMVDSDNGITNLHVPSDIIIDASMPAMIRNSGQMWDKNGQTKDTMAVIPDSSYAPLYKATIDFCKENGAFDPKTMGTVPNVGLMAQKAEEYGSHDKTFEISEKGVVQVLDKYTGEVLLEHQVEKGDIWRMCQVKDAPIQDWVKLAVKRAKATNSPAIFWLDKSRSHDSELIKKVNLYLKNYNLTGLNVQILSLVDATNFTLKRLKEGKDTISVTGNVLRDYLTDLFPILELGTSAKMLSIVPLMNGGGLFETGAGGSAPKHVQQFNKEGHLRWDSLGEFLALAVSLEFIGEKEDNKKASLLAKALDEATTSFLMNNRSPSRKVNEIDNRGSHFYLALYWAKELSKQNEDENLKHLFSSVYDRLSENETTIIDDLNNCQGEAINTLGYYKPNDEITASKMRPSNTFNEIIDSL
ncbi:MAG: NADP-dependent isocitrate dehydrogenase [Crocinitomicaceae bacterium]|nr:NADP-dependent isocitrate dehydrogenase [Crocinitomicaceae bacterium]